MLAERATRRPATTPGDPQPPSVQAGAAQRDLVNLPLDRLPVLPRRAWLELDLDALVENLAIIRRSVGPGVLVHPVVKADAYGHGALPIVAALDQAGADGFCVATLDEAQVLRRAGMRKPVRILYPIPPELAGLARASDLTVSAGDPVLLARMVAAADDAAASPAPGRAGGQLLDVELEVEAGLGRGGFEPTELLAAARLVTASRGVRLAGLWTHLQAPGDRERTFAQVARFQAADASLADAGMRVPTRHLAASGGLLRHVPGFDAVRPGLLLYGIVPDELDGLAETETVGIRPVLSLHAQPVRVIDLPAGHGISYGPTFVTARPSRIATLPLGYGDGWSRALSGRAMALVRGRRVPLIGTIAMDAVMADVTDVPGPPVTVDDHFVLIGDQADERITVAELARLRTTNRWEVVSQMAGRLPRVYHAASRVVGLRTLAERGD